MPIDQSAKELLESLKPTKRRTIIDSVEAAGISVDRWYVKADGTPAETPNKNPNYCYEWAFGGGDEPTALCIWHLFLKTSGGSIYLEDSLSQHALKLDPIASNPRNPVGVRTRARDQAQRARNFDILLQRAFRKSKPIRVILLAGEPREDMELGWDASKVKFRTVDSEPWYAHSYDNDNGNFRLVRGTPPSVAETNSPTSSEHPAYVDQFDIPEPSEKVDHSGTAYPRSKEVRSTALNRAKGECECCGKPGFTMTDGSIFLETHHVIPLSAKGHDVEWNLVAICPNCHRRAHYGIDHAEIQYKLVATLVRHFPAARTALSSLLAQSK